VHGGSLLFLRQPNNNRSVVDENHRCISPFDCSLSCFVLLSNYFVLNLRCWRHRRILEAKQLFRQFKNMNRKNSSRKTAGNKLLYQFSPLVSLQM